MPQDATPTVPAPSPTSSPATPVSTADVSNANNLNQAVAQVRQQLSTDNTAIIAQLNSVASHITSDLLGGNTGGTANKVLTSKGTSQRTLQASVVSIDGSGNVTGARDVTGLHFLEVETGNATTANEFQQWKPTDWAAGKPYIAIKKQATATSWQFILWDGSSTAGTIDFSATTLTFNNANFFDGIAPTTTQGDLIYRNASTNVALGAGTAGQRLVTEGASANPNWKGPTDTIASGNLSGTTVSITGISGRYSYLILHIAGASSDTATREMLVRVSTNNGSSYDGTAGNYPGFLFNSTASASAATTQASLCETTTVAAATTQTTSIKIYAYQGNAFPCAITFSSISSPATNYQNIIHYTGSTSAINAIQILWNSTGSFDAGTYTLLGVY